MFRARSDLPLSKDPAIRILPWIVGLMVYLATLTLAGGLLVSGLAADWSAGLTGALTIQIIPDEKETTDARDARVRAAIRAALKTPGIASARAMPAKEVAALLAPWLGADAAILDLPLPRIIDVRLAEGAAPDIAALKKRLAAAAPGASLDDHQLWRDRLVTFLRAIEFVAVVMVGVIGAATITVVVFSTRSGLAVHNEVIEILHLVGARDDYIAGQFQSHAFRLGLKGGIGGSIAGIATLLLLAQGAAGLDSELLPPLLFRFWHWPALATAPLVAALIARWTARRTVMRTLHRLL